MENPSSDQLKVLVVDDDELNQRMMRLLLTREGHHVQIACDGVDALRIVKSQDFDIILMDLQMPVMDGVEASRQIRTHENGGKSAYIVALTASYLPEKGQELFEAGIDNYIAKPFDVEHLRQMLAYGLDHRRLRNGSTSLLQSDKPVYQGSCEFDALIGIKMVGGDEETYRELLADFVEKLPEKIDRIERYLAENDLEAISRAAHNIKGVSSNLGVLQLSEYAQRLEKSTSQGYTMESLGSVVRETKAISQQFIADASIFLATPQNDTDNS